MNISNKNESNQPIEPDATPPLMGDVGRDHRSVTSYYHLAPLLLAPGGIIQPGNWGRIINCYRCEPQASQNASLMAREMAFEAVRAAKYSSLPSRLSCAFVFETLEHANQYKQNFSRWNSTYEVELLTPEAPSHRAGFNLIQFPPATVEFLPVVTQWAEAYWRGEEIQIPELLTKSPLRVRALVSTGPGCYQP